MNKIKQNKIIIISTLIGLLSIFVFTIASQNQDVLVYQNSQSNLAQVLPDYIPITGNTLVQDQSNLSFTNILKVIFNWMVAITMILAVIFIVIGGIQYMTTDAVYDKKEGLTKIQGAIAGLILALVSWLILATINPELLTLEFTVSDAPAFNPNSAVDGSIDQPLLPPGSGSGLPDLPGTPDIDDGFIPA